MLTYATPLEGKRLEYARAVGCADLTLEKLRINQVRAVRSALDHALAEFRAGDGTSAHAYIALAEELDRR
ncbi:hypothetical protein [Leucobacter japonicus]|uniref:hypothetical protein n=1 Tax=Leucobacter japonicus TaxID=1461259 RepID=UPI0006A7A569|nr:hypothetical protein [Leucobacter japonicus]